jgi:hypothetical protein
MAGGGGSGRGPPQDGDCLVQPVTKIIVKGHGTITRQ